MKSSTKILSTSIIFAILFFSLNVVSAQNKVEVEIDPFDKVKVSDNLNVVFIKGEKEGVSIVAEGIGYDKIITKTSGRELVIKVKSGVYKNSKIDIEVNYITLRSIEAANKANVMFNEKITGDELMIKASSNAVIIVEVDIKAVKASLSNGGRIEISGRADLQEVDANLGSKYNAFEFETENGYIKSNTKANVVVWVKNILEASANSKGVLKYKGTPAEVKSKTTLGGKISGDL